jgi:hypothetical protein
VGHISNSSLFTHIRIHPQVFPALACRTYHGSCRGVVSFSLGPRTGSAVPMSLLSQVSKCTFISICRSYAGPLGAQYCPVLLMSNVATHSTRLFAATSGVIAPPSSQNLSKPTPFVISVRINPGCTLHIATPRFFRSRLKSLQHMFNAVLLAWWP